MTIRVLATIPELPAAPGQVAPEPVAPLPEVAALPRPAPLPAPRRARARASFPGVSVAALAVMAAAIWSLVALREATRSGADREGTRIASEPVDAAATETTLR